VKTFSLSLFLVLGLSIQSAHADCVSEINAAFTNYGIAKESLDRKFTGHYQCSPEARELSRLFWEARDMDEINRLMGLAEKTVSSRETSLSAEIVGACRALGEKTAQITKAVQEQGCGLNEAAEKALVGNVDSLESELRFCEIDGWPYIPSVAFSKVISREYKAALTQGKAAQSCNVPQASPLTRKNPAPGTVGQEFSPKGSATGN
jgi:hypothetical protein